MFYIYATCINTNFHLHKRTYFLKYEDQSSGYTVRTNGDAYVLSSFSLHLTDCFQSNWQLLETLVSDDIILTGGFYIYSEGNSYLVGSQMSLSINVTYCLSFWYFIYGKTPSLTLSVYVGREQAYSRPEWSRHVSSASRTHRWNIGEVDIELRAPPFQVIFSTQSSNNASGTALDDISITEGSCSGSKPVFFT